jgi:hypothetical protein
MVICRPCQSLTLVCVHFVSKPLIATTAHGHHAYIHIVPPWRQTLLSTHTLPQSLERWSPSQAPPCCAAVSATPHRFRHAAPLCLCSCLITAATAAAAMPLQLLPPATSAAAGTGDTATTAAATVAQTTMRAPPPLPLLQSGSKARFPSATTRVRRHQCTPCVRRHFSYHHTPWPHAPPCNQVRSAVCLL